MAWCRVIARAACLLASARGEFRLGALFFFFLFSFLLFFFNPTHYSKKGSPAHIENP